MSRGAGGRTKTAARVGLTVADAELVGVGVLRPDVAVGVGVGETVPVEVDVAVGVAVAVAVCDAVLVAV